MSTEKILISQNWELRKFSVLSSELSVFLVLSVIRTENWEHGLYKHGLLTWCISISCCLQNRNKKNNSDYNRDLKTTFILKSTLHNNFGDNDDYNHNSKYLHHLCFLINLLLHSHKMIFYFFHMQLEVLHIFNSLEVFANWISLALYAPCLALVCMSTSEPANHIRKTSQFHPKMTWIWSEMAIRRSHSSQLYRRNSWCCRLGYGRQLEEASIWI